MTADELREHGWPRPPRASNHCRHYSYVVPITRPDSGPKCAVGCSLDEPGSTVRCMPDPRGTCERREEYTDMERAAWSAAQDAGLDRLRRAVKALPAPIPLRTSGSVECPNCGGQLHYARWHRGAEIQCETKHCAAAHFSIAAGKDWPSRKEPTNAQ